MGVPAMISNNSYEREKGEAYRDVILTGWELPSQMKEPEETG